MSWKLVTEVARLINRSEELVNNFKSMRQDLFSLRQESRDGFNKISKEMQVMKQELVDLNASLDSLVTEVQTGEGLLVSEANQIATLISNSSTVSPDDSADIIAATNRIKAISSELSAKIASITATASTTASTVAGTTPTDPNAPVVPPVVAPTPSSTTGDVPLAGVPATPPSAAGAGAAGAAVPNTDNIATDASPNLDTSAPGSAAVGADQAANLGQPVDATPVAAPLPGDATTPNPSAAAVAAGTDQQLSPTATPPVPNSSTTPVQGS